MLLWQTVLGFGVTAIVVCDSFELFESEDTIPKSSWRLQPLKKGTLGDAEMETLNYIWKSASCFLHEVQVQPGGSKKAWAFRPRS